MIPTRFRLKYWSHECKGRKFTVCIVFLFHVAAQFVIATLGSH